MVSDFNFILTTSILSQTKINKKNSRIKTDFFFFQNYVIILWYCLSSQVHSKPSIIISFPVTNSQRFVKQGFHICKSPESTLKFDFEIIFFPEKIMIFFNPFELEKVIFPESYLQRKIHVQRLYFYESTSMYLNGDALIDMWTDHLLTVDG